MSTIWIINQYASTPSTGIGGRHWYLARELAARGHRVYLIAARWHHLLRDVEISQAAPSMEKAEGFWFVRVPTAPYADAHDKRRVLNWLSFAWRLRKLASQIPHRPDAIMCSSPSLFSVLGAERLSRKFHARLIFEVRDIWPMTLVEIGGHSPRHPLIRLMQQIEDRAYRVSDRIVSNLPGAVEHMINRGMGREKFSWIPNGFCEDETENSDPVEKAVLAQIPTNKFVVGYAGTLGAANALDNLLDCANQLRDNEDIAFVLVGNGREKANLMEKSIELGLENVHFVNSLPKNMVHQLLKQFDICFIGWNDSPLYRFGIAANKMAEYLYSGRPILHCFSGSYDPVQAYDAGLTIEADNPALLAEAILHLQSLSPKERRRMGENGRKAALKYHEYGTLAEKLEEILVCGL